MATSADRMRAHRERARRGLRRLTIDVSEDDLRALVKAATRRRKHRPGLPIPSCQPFRRRSVACLDRPR